MCSTILASQLPAARIRVSSLVLSKGVLRLGCVLWCAGFTPAEAAPVLRDFGGRWKGSIEAMHKEVLGQVADGGCAREVLQVRM
jgi:hypothetical protein